MNIYLILHNIRSIENVGAMFRTADGAGISKIFLTGYTPSPRDRFGRDVAKMNKTALGATHTVPYEVYDALHACIAHLKESGVHIIAVEQHHRAVPYTEVVYPDNMAFIVGNEIEGVPGAVCDEADAVVHIPMHGTKESLNVSTATGIVLFHARNASTVR